MGVSGYVVVDASVAIKWLVREEHTDRALAILNAWHDEGLTPAAPYLLPFAYCVNPTSAGLYSL